LSRYTPQWQLHSDTSGKPVALHGPSGESVSLASISTEQPTPRRDVVGYWYSPTMDLLGHQKATIKSGSDAVALVQLWHLLWRGPEFVRQKLYAARAFTNGWVITVDHDF